MRRHTRLLNARIKNLALLCIVLLLAASTAAASGTEVVNVSVNSREVAVGDEVAITVLLQNPETVNNSDTVELAVDETIVESRSVAVPAESTRTVRFRYPVEESGNLSVQVNSLDAGRITATETPTGRFPRPSRIITGLIVVLLLMGGLYFYLTPPSDLAEEQRARMELFVEEEEDKIVENIPPETEKAAS